MTTSAQKIPSGYQAVMPYLILKETAGFLDFMKQVFDATEKSKHLREDNTVMHAEVTVGNSTIMCAEASDEWKSQPAGLFVYVDNADETYEKALAAGASLVMALSDQPYGRTCGVLDPYGNTWWITTAK